MQSENTKAKPSLKRLSYRPGELPAVTGIGRTRIYQLIADGTLESRLIGRTRLVSAESVERLIQGED
jgi:excisionase family DNA binding protein